jgi:hypothetical protein
MARKHINIRAGFDLQGFSTSGQNLEREFKKTARKMQSIGKTLSMSLTAPIVGLAGLSVNVFAEFEQTMAKVSAVSGAAASQLLALKKNAEDLGSSTRFAASEVAGLQLTLSKLGFKPDEILASTDAILRLSLASGEDLVESATVAASTLRGFQFDVSEAGRVADIMAKSFSSSSLDLDKFSTAMGYIAPVANAAGVSIERSSAMMSTLSDAGIEASTVGTSLRQIFIRLATKGISYEEAMNRIRNATDKVRVANDLFGDRAFAAGIVLSEQGGKVDELTESYINSEGAAKSMADIMDNTLQGAFFKVKSAVESAMIALGEKLEPTMTIISNKIAHVVSKFKDLDPKIKRIIIVVGVFTAAIGPVLLALGFLGTTLIPALISGFTILTGPIGLTIAAIAALAFVVYKNWDTIMAYVNKLTGYFTDLYNESVVVRVGIQSIVLVFKTVWEAGKLMVNLLVDAFKFLGKVILTPFISLAKIVKAILTGDFKSIGGIIADAFTKPIKLAGKFLSDAAGDFKEFGMNTAKNFNDGVDAVLKREKTVILEPKTEIKMEGVTDDGDEVEVEGDGNGQTTVLTQLQSKLADIQFAGSQRLRQIRHEVAMLSMQDEEQIALERLNFAQEQAENELDFQISQLENKKVLSEDEKAQLENLQAEKAAIIEQYFAELAAMENDANANQLSIKEAALKKQNDLLQLENANAAATQDEYNKAEKEREENHLKALIDLRKQYGKDVTDLEIQLAEKKFEIQKGANSKAESLAADLGALISNQISAIVNSTMGSLADFVRDAAAGVEKENKNFGDSFMANVGKFMQDLGKAMVAIGVANLTIIKGLAAGPLGAPLLIAGGVALLAAGAAMEGVYSKGIGSASESGGGNVNPGVTNIDAEPIVMETRIEGNQLILVQNRSNSFRR